MTDSHGSDPKPDVRNQGDPRLLLLKQENFRERTEALLERLRKDEELQQGFIQDPSGLVAEHLLPEAAAGTNSQYISDSNKLLFSVLANEKFVNWLADFRKELTGKYGEQKAPLDTMLEDRHEFVQELAKGILNFGDEDILQNLLASSGPSQPDLQGVALSQSGVLFVALFVAVVIVLVIVLIGEPRLGSDLQPIGPADLRAVTDQLVVRAELLKRAAQLSTLRSRVL